MAKKTIKQVLKEFQKALKVSYQSQKNIVDISQTYINELYKAESGGGGGGSVVEYYQVLQSGTKIGEIVIDDVQTNIFAPTPTEPTDVDVTQVVSSGTKIATITVDSDATDIYAPDPTSVSVTQIQSTGTKIATVSVDGVSTDLYAPNGGGGGSTVAYTQTATSGLECGTITIDNVATKIYAPLPFKITSAVTGAVGATSVTIQDADIATTSLIDVYAETSSGKVIGITQVVVTTGQAVVSFNALEESTSFKLQIIN